MTINEAKQAIDKMKEQGISPKEIAGAFYLMFVDGKINVEQLDAFVNLLGFHLTDEFKQMSPQDQKTKGYKESKDRDGNDRD